VFFPSGAASATILMHHGGLPKGHAVADLHFLEVRFDFLFDLVTRRRRAAILVQGNKRLAYLHSTV
jgi:hypothetical protein